eukprot:scaffold109020_cov21-Tisochrysis_lutea.AAC.1
MSPFKTPCTCCASTLFAPARYVYLGKCVQRLINQVPGMLGFVITGLEMQVQQLSEGSAKREELAALRQAL